MSKLLTKEVEKIIKKLDSISRLGKDGYFDYCIFVDSLIAESRYGYFELTMMKKYFVDINTYPSVNEVKKETYKIVLAETYSDDAKKIKKLYDRNNVYQVGLDIYRSDNNVKLGQIKEIDRLNFSNRPVPSEGGLILVDLEVIKEGLSYFVTEGTQLIDKYNVAVQILLDPVFVETNGHWTDAGYWIDNEYWID